MKHKDHCTQALVIKWISLSYVGQDSVYLNVYMINVQKLFVAHNLDFYRAFYGASSKLYWKQSTLGGESSPGLKAGAS